MATYWDPVIAISLSCWVVWSWGGQAREHILNLVGRSAPPELLQKLTFLAYHHDLRVRYIDTVRLVPQWSFRSFKLPHQPTSGRRCL